jgi:hypothetical protein
MSVQPNIAAATPPRRGAVYAITLDNTAREYDLDASAFGGIAQTGHAGQESHVCLRFESVGTITYLYFSDVHDATPDLNDATVIAAGGALAFDTEMCGIIPSGQYRDFWIDRNRDRYLTIKGAAAGTLRVWAVSEAQV